MKFADIPMICTHESTMRMMRNSSELRQYYLEKERQAMLECASFKDALQAFAENRANADIATIAVGTRLNNNMPPMPITQLGQRMTTATPAISTN